MRISLYTNKVKKSKLVGSLKGLLLRKKTYYTLTENGMKKCSNSHIKQKRKYYTIG